MGVVYEAEQISLGRRVALKVLPLAAALDPRHLQRFKNEAQAAAHLQHQHIVPVYAVGCERGMHYYAMQFIDGQSLAAVIHQLRQLAGLGADEPADSAGPGGGPAGDSPPGSPPAEAAEPTAPAAALATERSTDSPAYFRSVARLGLQAALALEYAHAEGVLHRDIKPANLLVNGRGALWVTDFGLARLAGEAGLTRTGDLLGTLRYMSPEQALGLHGRVDERTDVYALGATLYELLTLEPVHDGADRQALLRQIGQEEPRAPRRLNPAVPADLETIVLKALAKEPADRYRTAQELADDLRRFLEDKPIRARRPTPGQVVAKWARRHRGVVVTAAVAVLVGLVLGVAGLVVSNFWIRQEKVQAEAARQRADRNVALAVRALDRIYLRVAEERYPRDPRREREDRELLALALAFYQEVARENDADPRARQAVAVACLRIANIRELLGQYGPAKEAFERGLALSARLAAERPTDYDVRAGLAAGHQNLAELLMKTGDRPAAAIHYRQALELWTALAADFPAELGARCGRAGSHNDLGRFVAADGAWAEAEEHYRQALALEEQLAGEFPADPSYRRNLAASQGNLGNLMRETGQLAEADTCSRRALDLFSRLAAEYPGEPSYREGEARAHRNLAALLQERDPVAARAHYRQALDLQTRLAADFPAVPGLQHQRADTLHLVGILLAEGGERASAAGHFRLAQELEAKLAADFPTVPDYRQLRVAILSNLGKLAQETGDRAAAGGHYRRALELQARLAADFPDAPLQRENLALRHQCLGDLLENDGDWEGAESHWGQALAIGDRLAADFPAVPRYREQLAHSHQCLGLLRHARGGQASAAGHFRRAVALWAELAAQPRRGEAGRGNRGAALNAHARFLATGPDPRRREPKRAVELARQAVEWAPRNGVYWTTLGMAHYRAGKLREALAALERARQLRKGRDPAEGFFLAMTHARLGAREEARQWFDEAARFMEARQPGSEHLRRFRAEAAAELGIDEPPRGQGRRP
jgi:tetratricopeptide (TPR) repeat protein